MAEPCLVLFDDAVVQEWHPITDTRPAGELLFGTMTLRERAELVFATTCVGHLSADDLASYAEPGARPVLGKSGVPRDRDVVYLSSRAVPAWPSSPIRLDGAPRRLTIGSETVGWFAPAGSDAPPPAFFLAPGENAPEAPALDLDGILLERPWHLITGNAEQVARDVAFLFPGHARPDLPDGVHVIGDAPLIVGDGAFLEPGTVLDLRRGPVWLDAGASVAAFTKIAGPSYIGRRTQLLGGPFEAVSIGPVCKAHGELETSVLLGYTNKSHDGFIGHTYVGAWVNFGAMTTNSDLKNNYGSVRIWTPGGEVDTGEIKLGCLIGDHVKTAIGTLLNTGTVVGTGSNLFGSGIPPKYVPPFSWGWGDSAVAYELERFLQSAEMAMSRRDVPLNDGQRTLLERVWKRARSDS